MVGIHAGKNRRNPLKKFTNSCDSSFMHVRGQLQRAVLITLLAGVAALPLQAQSSSDLPAASPGRPTVSAPATLSPVGYLQFENGVLYADGAPTLTAQFSLNQVTRLSVTPRIELISQWEPMASSSRSSEANNEDEPGGVSLGLQTVLLRGHGLCPTTAVSYLRSIYSGKAPDLDIGSSFQGMQLLFSIDAGKFHADINGLVDEQRTGVYRRAQYGQSIAVSRPFGRWTAAGDIWHFTQPLLNSNAVGNLWSVSYTLRPNLVFDAGLDHRLTDTSTQWEGFAGFTYLLPHRLWRKRG
jgi:hypothetical protein